MTAIQKKDVNPVAHLTREDIEELGRELDAIRQSVLDTRGERDAKYIRTGVDENGVSWSKIMSLEEYREDVAYAFKIVPFYEIELERRVEQFGNIAHAWSTYEERRDPNLPQPLPREWPRWPHGGRWV